MDPGLTRPTTLDEPNIGRTATLGAALGFLVVTIATTTAGTLGGIGAMNSLGLGAFAGMWGGVGFGFMVGAAFPLARHLNASDHGRSANLDQAAPIGPPPR